MNFEKYLQTMYENSHPQILDDDLTDGFDDWLQGFDVAALMMYAQEYGDYREKETQDKFNQALMHFTVNLK